ncbi:MAG: winged helix-turn-helix domain-containing protein [Vicinamibacterales bacterium]
MFPRKMSSSRGVVRFGPFEFDPAADQLKKGGRATRLRGQPLKVLTLLVDRPGEVVTRDDLRQALWGDQSFGEFDVGLNAAIRRLRRALADSADVPRYIETLPGRGYRFIAPVEPLADITDEADGASHGTVASAPDSAIAPAATRVDDRGRWRWAAGVAALGLVAGLGAWQAGLLRARDDASPAGAPIRSVAVLPFQNLSSDQEWGFFASGLADALLAELGQIHELKVISRTSTLRYADTTRSIPEIAGELGVDAVVEGSVSRSPERVRVTVQLIDGRTDRHLWSNSYERPIEDSIALQDDLVTAIVREMGVAVTPEEATRLAAAPPVSTDAYMAYLRGRYFWEQRTVQGLDRAIALFEEAIARAPGYAAAYTGLADAYGLLPRYGTVDPRVALARSKEYAERALALDPDMAEAHTALAKALYTLDWNWSDAGAHFERAIALNPSYATAHHWYSLHLMIVGRMDEALAEALKAREVDPVARAVHTHAAWVRYLAGDAATAGREAQVGIDMAPRHFGNYQLLGWIARAEGRYEAAEGAFQTAVNLDPDDWRVRAALAGVQAAAGRRDQAQGLMRELEARRATEPIPTEAFVNLNTALGELDQAFAWLERCAEDRSISYFLFDLRYEPLYAPLRSDPRLAALFRSMGLDLAAGAGADARTSQ